MTLQPMVVDLSHWDPADDYAAVRHSGIIGVIYKATEGQGYTDPTYVSQQHAAKAAGLRWGSYHFADASSVSGQIDNYLHYAAPDPDELFCLDWEDNPSGGGAMSLEDAKIWIAEVEQALHRPGECVLYSGNTAKEALGNNSDSFLGRRRLWLAQYASEPSWQESWKNYWLWQFTDGIYGPSPHSIDGIGPCDINSYAGTAQQLAAEWASGRTVGSRPPPDVVTGPPTVDVLISAPAGVLVKVRQFPQVQNADRRRGRHLREAQ